MALYYLTFGTYCGLSQYNLNYSPAAHQKTSYIIDLIDEMGMPFSVISLSRTDNKKLRWFPQKSVKCGKNGRFVVWGMIGKANRPLAGIQKLIRIAQLRRFLKCLKPTDTVVVYHSLFISKTVMRAKKKYGFTLVLELEELYQDVIRCKKKEAKYEKKVIDCADGFILATEYLMGQIQAKKECVVINGTYKSEPKYDESFDDGKVHCVYAGTFDPTKGGLSAASTALYLPENYHIHILGFGTDRQIEVLKKQIKNVRLKGGCSLSYDGLKKGEEYSRFLQKCHIGLCTQIPDAKYANSSFPSKILVYLANGLRVLSVRIPAIENSSVGDFVAYYDGKSPREIAEAIMNIDMNEAYDSRERLEKLHVKATLELGKMIRSLSSAGFEKTERKR